MPYPLSNKGSAVALFSIANDLSCEFVHMYNRGLDSLNLVTMTENCVKSIIKVDGNFGKYGRKNIRSIG